MGLGAEVFVGRLISVAVLAVRLGKSVGAFEQDTSSMVIRTIWKRLFIDLYYISKSYQTQKFPKCKRISPNCLVSRSLSLAQVFYE
jgi:hypothetical protein